MRGRKHRESSDLHVVEPDQEVADKNKNSQTRYNFRKRVITWIVVMLVCMAGGYLFLARHTFTEVRVISTRRDGGSGNNQYLKFDGEILRYSRDGASLLNRRGEEQWNKPYQFQTPLTIISGNTAIIGDIGGNEILVFQRDGLKGEVQTALPIERIAVSHQGIVAAILRDEISPQILKFDAVGTLLVERRVSLSETGYPIEVAISPDGLMMLVTYLYTRDGSVATRVGFYNFANTERGQPDHQVVFDEYQDTIIPTAFFMEGETSALIGDANIFIYEGRQTPELMHNIEIDKKIRSAFHSERYIGLVLENEGSSSKELRLYNRSANMVLSEEFEGEYSSIRLVGGQVIMFEQARCIIFTRSGVKRFDGELDGNIIEMFPVRGINRYLVMGTNGMSEVRLVR